MQIRNALLNGPLGFGAAPLGNMFRNIPDEEPVATVEAALHKKHPWQVAGPTFHQPNRELTILTSHLTTGDWTNIL